MSTDRPIVWRGGALEKAVQALRRMTERQRLAAAVVDAARELVTPTAPAFWPRERIAEELSAEIGDDEPWGAEVRKDQLLTLCRAVWALDDLDAGVSPVSEAPAEDWRPAIASRVVVGEGPLSGRHGTVVHLEPDGFAIVSIDAETPKRYTMPAANLRREGGHGG